MLPLTLYYLRYTTQDGEDLSLFVYAHSIEEACAHWRLHWEIDAGAEPNEAWEIPQPIAEGRIHWPDMTHHKLKGGNF